MSAPVVLVVGAGPGIGAAVAHRFAGEGYAVALVGRSRDTLTGLADGLRAEGVTVGWTAADLTDEAALTAAVTRFGGIDDRLDVVHFNPSTLRERGPLELGVEELLADVRLGVGALLTTVQAARPFLHPGARVMATGSRAADRPWSGAASLGVQKAGLRNLVGSLDDVLAPDGVRAATLTVNGTLAAGTVFDPVRVADALHAACLRTDEAWTTEVVYPG